VHYTKLSKTNKIKYKQEKSQKYVIHSMLISVNKNKVQYNIFYII